MKAENGSAAPCCGCWAGVGGVAIAAGLVLAADGLGGDPLSRAWAERRALALCRTCPLPGPGLLRCGAAGAAADFSLRRDGRGRGRAPTHGFDVEHPVLAAAPSGNEEQAMVEDRGTGR